MALTACVASLLKPVLRWPTDNEVSKGQNFRETGSWIGPKCTVSPATSIHKPGKVQRTLHLPQHKKCTGDEST